MPLTDLKVKQAVVPPIKPYKLYDEGGLLILVHPNGGKYWRFKYMYEGKEKLLALGVYPDVSLAMARDRRDAARRQVAEGIDPSEQRRAEKEAGELDRANTFRAVADEWLAVRSKNLSVGTLANVTRRLTAYILPELGSLPITQIDAPTVLRCLRKIENNKNYELARRVRQNIGQILRFGAATGKKARDVTTDLIGVTVSVQSTSQAAITSPDLLQGLLKSIWEYDGERVICAALKLLPMVFLRPSELAEAEWSELDLDNGMMLIPAHRMKMKSSHIVPLSTQAVLILKDLRELSGNYTHVFPNRRRCVSPMSRSSFSSALHRMGYKGEQTAHGFRATARTILDEVLDYRPEWIEMQLAHEVVDPNGRAYNRTAFLPQRVQMMQAWSDYLDQLRVSNPRQISTTA